MVFYLDLILLLNFLIDYLILLATSKFLNLKYKRWRMAIAALLGAAYTLVYFVPNLEFTQLLITKVLISVLIIIISFGFNHLILFFQTVATFYLVSFILGGGVLAIQYLFNIEHEIINGIYISRSQSPLMVIIIIIVSSILIWLFSNRTYKSIRRKSNITEGVVEVEVFLGEDVFKCKGLIDTGNRLYDPITRNPVMIIEAKEISFIPSIIGKSYKNGQFQLEIFNSISNELELDWLSRIHLVPYRTVSKSMQFIIAIRPDKVVIKDQNNKIHVQTKVLVGLDYEQLSNDKIYQAIIHPELIVG